VSTQIAQTIVIVTFEVGGAYAPLDAEMTVAATQRSAAKIMPAFACVMLTTQAAAQMVSIATRSTGAKTTVKRTKIVAQDSSVTQPPINASLAAVTTKDQMGNPTIHRTSLR
jgi:hypothetical protein